MCIAHLFVIINQTFPYWHISGFYIKNLTVYQMKADIQGHFQVDSSRALLIHKNTLYELC